MAVFGDPEGVEWWTERDCVAAAALPGPQWSELRFRVGDILDQEAWIAHQCACTAQDPMGIAAAIFGRYPQGNRYERRKAMGEGAVTEVPGD